MAWIESHTVLVRHRKTMELAIRLNLKPVHVMGHLHALWHTVLEQQEDGDLSKWSDQLIAQSAQWDGNATEFVAHLRELGFIDGHLIHDWIDYVGPYLTKKYSTGNPQRLKEIWAKHGYKYGKGNGKFAKQKASGKRAGSDPKSAIPLPSLPNPSLPNLTKPEEEESPDGERVARVEDLRLDHVSEWATKEGIDLTAVRLALAEFVDYWKSVGGKRKGGQVVKDWPATFRNRLRTLKAEGKVKLSVIVQHKPNAAHERPVSRDPPTEEALGILGKLLPSVAAELEAHG